MRIEWVHALSCMALLLVFAVILDRFHLAPMTWWVASLLTIPTGLFVWVAPMFFWDFVYRRMGWKLPTDDFEDSN